MAKIRIRTSSAQSRPTTPSIEGLPIAFGIHLCKGNARTTDPATGKVVPQWHREGHYDEIAERVFSRLKHHRFLLEYDDDRSGGFSPLKHIASEAVAVVGLVEHKVRGCRVLGLVEATA